MRRAMKNCMIEVSFISKKVYKDPFNEIELSVAITDPESKTVVVPAFWAGGQIWCIRYASSIMGIHKTKSICSDKSNLDLNDKEGTIEIVDYNGENPLFKHGPLKVSENKKYLQHSDGKPFFWLADTWWMGFSKRLSWPHDFMKLTGDRAKKGFSVIQIVAGLYPDMVPFDKRGANESGFPWDEEFKTINPEYFDMIDHKIAHLVYSGIVPCIVGCWGFYIDFAGREALKKHWKYIVARYGAYPVVWCMAGEAIMPFYGSTSFTAEENEKYKTILNDKDKKLEYYDWAKKEWTEITKFVRSINCFNNPVTIHPTDYGHNMICDRSLIDIDLLQTGHGSWNSFSKTVDMMCESVSMEPRMPVINGEVCYEGIGNSSYADVQRFVFWASILSGAAGHSYGANGIWQVNREHKPFGASPQGVTWGNTPWEEAYKLPGSKQLGISKRILEQFNWWKIEPHNDWCEPHSTKENRIAPYAAGVEEEFRIIFIPFCTQKPIIKKIEKNIKYNAHYVNLINGEIFELGEVKPDSDNNWTPENPMPIFSDLLLVLKRI